MTSSLLLIGVLSFLFALSTEEASSQAGPTLTPTRIAPKQPMAPLVSSYVLLPFISNGSQFGMPYWYSAGDASGDLMVQAYTRFTAPGLTIDSGGGPNSCQQGAHINEALWMHSTADQVLPPNQDPAPSWMEVGFMGGVNLGDPLHWGCDLGYYYASYPFPFNGSVDVEIPMGLGGGPHDYWIRFDTPTVHTTGMYVIIDGVEQIHYTSHGCCSNDINVGLEYHGDINAQGWSSSPTDDTPLAYYTYDGANWIVHDWSGCTAAGYPNNCSRQDPRDNPRMGGQWVNVYTDYRNWFPLQ